MDYSQILDVIFYNNATINITSPTTPAVKKIKKKSIPCSFSVSHLIDVSLDPNSSIKLFV